MSEPEWYSRAACAVTGKIHFHALGQQTYARSICWSCPVLSKCLDHALEHNIPDDMWGGMQPAERVQFANLLPTSDGREAILRVWRKYPTGGPLVIARLADAALKLLRIICNEQGCWEGSDIELNVLADEHELPFRRDLMYAVRMAMVEQGLLQVERGIGTRPNAYQLIQPVA